MFYFFHGFDGGVKVAGKKINNNWIIDATLNDRWNFHDKKFSKWYADWGNQYGLYLQRDGSLKNFNTTVHIKTVINTNNIN